MKCRGITPITRSTALLLFSVSCAAVDPPKAPEPKLDTVELFRRARFKELSELDSGSTLRWVARIRPKGVTETTDIADWTARVAYRKGDAQTALDAIAELDDENRTKKIIAALLDNVKTDRTLRETVKHPDLLKLPLVPEALAAGFPVVEIEVNGRKFKMLWDTGASENVLSPPAVDELELLRTEVQFPVLREIDGYVVRFAATGTDDLQIGAGWKIRNVPWLVADLATVATLLRRKTEGIDGFLSPQLLVPQGCFEVDRANAVLRVGFDPILCQRLIAPAKRRAPVFTWNGEVYASAFIHQSPEVAVQLETGSPVTFLRSDATRYLPKGVLGLVRDTDEEIAHDLRKTVVFQVAGKKKSVSAIDLEPRRRTEGHDDLASLGTDVLLSARGFVVSFATMELGFIEDTSKVAKVDGTPAIAPAAEKR